MATRSRFFRRKCWTSSCSRSWKPTAQNNFARNAFHFARFLLYLLVRPANRAMGASSSVGQSWRLITAWSRVQVLAGPPYSSYSNPILYEKGFGYVFVYRKFCGRTPQSVKRAKAGYHYDGGILPFALRNQVRFVRTWSSPYMTHWGQSLCTCVPGACTPLTMCNTLDFVPKSVC